MFRSSLRLLYPRYPHRIPALERGATASTHSSAITSQSLLPNASNGFVHTETDTTKDAEFVRDNQALGRSYLYGEPLLDPLISGLRVITVLLSSGHG